VNGFFRVRRRLRPPPKYFICLADIFRRRRERVFIGFALIDRCRRLRPTLEATLERDRLRREIFLRPLPKYLAWRADILRAFRRLDRGLRSTKLLIIVVVACC